MNFLYPVTPDFGLSDLWNHYSPLKYLFFTALKEGKWLLWTDKIGNGFPIFAQGQVGAMNLLNLLLFGLFPFDISLILFYPVNLLVGFIGMYRLLNKWYKFSSLISLFSAMTFCLSGFFIGQHTHWDIFQAGLLFPWLWYFYLKAFSSHKIQEWLWFTFVLTQQIFTGNLQIPFICLVGISIHILHQSVITYQLKQSLIKLRKAVFLFFIAITFGLCMGAVQLLPTWEFKQQTTRSQGIPLSQSTAYPFIFSDLLLFLNPLAKGNPATGNYHQLNSNQAIFWENSCFMGFFSVLLVGLSFLDRKRRPIFKFYYLLALVGLLFVLGSNSPLYFIYAFFPFNQFRVPSRFLLLVVFAFTILQSGGLEYLSSKIKTKKTYLFFFWLIIIINLSSQIAFISVYVPLANLKQALLKPNTIDELKLDDKSKIYTLFSYNRWNEHFYQGWEPTSQFIELQNFLPANINLLWNVKSAQIHNSLMLKKHEVLDNLIGAGIKLSSDNKGKIVKIDAQSMNFMKTMGVTHLISAYPVENLEPVNRLNTKEDTVLFYTYPIGGSLPLFYLAGSIDSAATTNDFLQQIAPPDFTANKTVILENSIYQKLNSRVATSSGKILSILPCSKVDLFTTCLKVTTSTDQPRLLVYNDLIYPGWKASVNQQQEPIIQANLFQQAVVIPKGDNVVEFRYQPKWFMVGLVVSVISHLSWVGWLFLFPNRNPKIRRL